MQSDRRSQLAATDMRPFLTSLQLFLQIRAQLTYRERFLDKTKYFPERIFFKRHFLLSISEVVVGLETIRPFHFGWL